MVQRLLLILSVGAWMVVWHGHASGRDWNNREERGRNRQDKTLFEKRTYCCQRENWREDDWKKEGEAGEEKKFCSPEQEKELLELLNQLQDITLNKKDKIGGSSTVRKKYRIARKLRKYDDCRAEDALRRLIRENACEEWGEGDIICVKWAAKKSLQKIGAAKDLKKLVSKTPLDEQLKIIRKYTKRPYKNDLAFHKIKKYLVQQSLVKPEFFVPLLVELFPRHRQTEKIARLYPGPAGRGLAKSLAASDPYQVWWGINLARYLGRSKFLPRVHDVAFREKGTIDYTNKAEVREIQTAAIGFYRAFEQQALPYYRDVLYSDFAKGREYVISGIKDLRNPELLAMLKEYFAYLQEGDKSENKLLQQRLKKKIAFMEAAGK